MMLSALLLALPCPKPCPAPRPGPGPCPWSWPCPQPWPCPCLWPWPCPCLRLGTTPCSLLSHRENSSLGPENSSAGLQFGAEAEMPWKYRKQNPMWALWQPFVRRAGGLCCKDDLLVSQTRYLLASGRVTEAIGLVVHPRFRQPTWRVIQGTKIPAREGQ